MIPHACAIRTLVIAMIEAAFRASAVPLPSRRDRPPTRNRATPRRAVRVATIAGDTDRKDPMTPTADFLAKGRVHGVGAATVRSNWTYNPNRGTTGRTASACWSPRQSRGSGGSVRALTLSLLSLRDQSSTRPTKRAWTVRACGRTERAHKSLGKPHSTRFPTPPTARSFSLAEEQRQDHRQERRDEHRPDLRDLR